MKPLFVLLLLGASPLLAQNAAPTPTPQKSRAVPVRKAYALPEATPAKAAPKQTPAAARAKATPTPTPAAKATPAPKAKGKPAASPEAEAEATPKKRGFFSRVFGPDEHPRGRFAPKPTPTVLPAATPTPTPRARPRSQPAPTGLPDPAQQTELPSADPLSPSASASSSGRTIAVPTPTPRQSTGRVVTKVEPGAAAAVTTPIPGEFDRNRYVAARKKALASPEVTALSEKLNAAPPGEADKETARQYTQTLFEKIRTLDPKQKEWYDRLEAATLRRIDSGKPFVAE